jgi:hypothetical protein
MCLFKKIINYFISLKSIAVSRCHTPHDLRNESVFISALGLQRSEGVANDHGVLFLPVSSFSPVAMCMQFVVFYRVASIVQNILV